MKKLALILLFSCAACTTEARHPASSKTAPADKVAAGASAPSAAGTLGDIQRLIGTPTCSDNAQCRTVAVGALACGGPQEYLAWSTTRTSERDLMALAERFKGERQAQIKSSGEMSICIHRPDPGAVCVSGTCQLNASSPAS